MKKKRGSSNMLQISFSFTERSRCKHTVKWKLCQKLKKKVWLPTAHKKSTEKGIASRFQLYPLLLHAKPAFPVGGIFTSTLSPSIIKFTHIYNYPLFYPFQLNHGTVEYINMFVCCVQSFLKICSFVLK